ncbi:MAG: DEAD/DEAH box helicase family protein [Alphaproteobacteria bacterium]|nr:DEAD/DEAH box helicase family protein [Alphaproteobacteria bacterium]
MSDNTKSAAALQAADPHTIPVLVSASSLSLRKRFYKKEDGSVGKEDYCNAKHFSVFHRTASSIRELSAVLSDLEIVSNNGIIRGAINEGVAPKKVRRLKKNFADVPRYFICIDVDELACPDLYDPLTESAETIIDYIIDLLPPEFHDASYHYQFSSSFGTEGLTGNGTFGQTLKAHIWFMLDQPRTCEELHRWAQAANDAAGFKLVDVSLYNPVQMHYVSRPHFDELIDPVKERSGFVERENDVVAIVIPDRKPPAAAIASGQRLTSVETAPGFENKLERIGPGGFHNPIYRAMCSYFWTCGHNGTDPDPAWLKQRLQGHIREADKGGRETAYIERCLSDNFLDDQIGRVYEQFQEGFEAIQQPSMDVVPTYPDKTKTLPEARKAVMDFVEAFIWQTLPAYMEAEEQYMHLHEKWRTLKRDAEEKGLMFFAPEPMPPVHPFDVLAPDVGTGKTYATLAYISRYIIRKKYLLGEALGPVVMMVPTIELAEEMEREAIRQGIRNVGIMRGRLRDNSDGTSKKMCKDPERIKAVEGFAGNAREYACGNGAGDRSCRHFAECAYQRQKITLKQKDLIIMAHTYLYLPPPIKNLAPEFVVIDEDITKSAIPDENKDNPNRNERDVLFDFLLEHRPVPDGQNRDGAKETEFLMRCSRRLYEALASCPDGSLSRKALEQNKITVRDCRKAAYLESIRIEEPDNIFPKLDTKTLVRRAKKVKNLRPYYILASMWELLAAFLDSPDQTICATVRTVQIKDRKILRILKKRTINEAYQRPTLLLDATFNQEAFRTIFCNPNRYLSIEVEKPHQYVRQITDIDVAVNSFTELDKKGQRVPSPMAYNVISHVRKIARLYAGKGEGKYDVLVVLPSKVEKLFQPLPENVALAHYNNIRGKNIYEGVACLIIASRLQPPVYSIEEKAEAAKQSIIDRIMPNKFGQFYYPERTLALRLADGSGQPVPRQRYHWDPMADALLQGSMVAEIIQAIGRGRGVNRTGKNPLAVDIITNIAMPITVNETMTHHELLSNRYDYMVMNGAMLCSPADQTTAYPGLFETPKSAPKYWENMSKNTPHTTIEEYTIAKWGELILRGANVPITHKVEYRSHDKARGRAKTFLYNAQIISSPLDWLKAYVSSDAVLVSGPEKLPWEASDLPWSEKLALPSQISRETSHLLPMPDLDNIERTPRTKDQEMEFTLEDLGHWYGKSKTEIQALLKKHEGDEQAAATELLCRAVISAEPANRAEVYNKLPQEVQEKLNLNLLQKLPYVQDLPPVSIITGRPD